MLRTIRRLAYGCIDFLLPVQCLFCGTVVPARKRRVPLCDRDLVELPQIHPPFCEVCCRPLPDAPSEGDQNGFLGPSENPFRPICGVCRTRELVFERVHIAFQYRDRMKVLVQDWKFGRNPEWGPFLGELMAQVLQDRLTPGAWDFLQPIPLHGTRRKERGFNQALQLAQGFGRNTQLPVFELLRKHRKTPPQASLSRDQRLKNLEQAFSVVKQGPSLKNRNILLVDDIFTTGSTLSSAARVLLKAGAGRVSGVALARAV